MTQHPEEGTLHAYIDGELAPAEAVELEAHVAGCESCAAALAEARGLVAAASRAISALDVAPSSARPVRSAPATAIPVRRRVRPPVFRVPYARAAALLLLVGGTALVVDRSGTLDRAGAPRSELLTADEAMPAQVAPAAAPVAAATATPEAAPAPAATSANTSTRVAAGGAGSRSDGRAAAAFTGKAVASTGAARGVAADAPTRDRSEAPLATPPAPAPLMESREVSSATSQKRIAPSEAAGLPAVATAAPASPPPARALDMSVSEPVSMNVPASTARVTRYRTREGTIVTLTEEPLRASFAEETAGARRTAAQTPPQRVAPQAAQAGSAAPAVNTYRWVSAELGRTYTLTGALPVAELEALSKRLGELQRLP